MRLPLTFDHLVVFGDGAALHVAADVHNLLGDVAVDAVYAQVAVAALVDGVEAGERNLVYHLLVDDVGFTHLLGGDARAHHLHGSGRLGELGGGADAVVGRAVDVAHLV